MIRDGGGELGRRRDGDARAARAAGVRPGFRVVYPDGRGSVPAAPSRPAAEAPRPAWAAPSSEGPGLWSVGGTSERQLAPARTGSGAAVLFVVVLLAAWAFQCWGAR